MNQFKVGERVWYTFEGHERVYRIVEIRGNVAILLNEGSNEPKIEAYLDELRPHNPCTNTNLIGRASCEYTPPRD
jgi:hypothetical protein